MEFISQKKTGTRNIYFRVKTDTAGVVASMEPYDCRVLPRKEDDGTLLLVLIDRKGNIRTDAFHYLNETLRATKYATRRQIATALNLFYIWSDLTGADPKHLNAAQVKDFVDFLWGVNVKAAEGGSRTVRTPKTVNAYYAFIKQYVIKNDWDKAAFEQRDYARRELVIGDINMQLPYSRDPNRMRVDPLDQSTPPMHLNPEQARALIDVVKKAGDLTTLLLIELQMGYGLRRGEAIGITLEDLKKSRNVDGKMHYTIILRNRVSDAPDQHCKGLYHPTSTDEYSKTSYKNAVRWVVDIKEDLYNRLVSYYEGTRGARMKAERRDRMRADTLADSVEPFKESHIRENHYLFVGKNGRKLSGQTYNNHLQEYFSTIGIQPDRGTKLTNCSHKLRHTFAMVLTTYMNHSVTREQLRLLLRHRSVISGEAYFTPTREETTQMKEDFVKMVHDIIGGFGESNFVFDNN